MLTGVCVGEWREIVLRVGFNHCYYLLGMGEAASLRDSFNDCVDK